MKERKNGIARAWRWIGHLLARTNNFIWLALAYYLVLTPVALVQRLAGRDPLRLRRRPGQRSFWIERRDPLSPDDFDRPW